MEKIATGPKPSSELHGGGGVESVNTTVNLPAAIQNVSILLASSQLTQGNSGSTKTAACQSPWEGPYLLGVGQVELGCQVDDLQLHNVLLAGERLGHLTQHIGCNLGYMFAVLANQPQDAGPGHGYLRAGQTDTAFFRLPRPAQPTCQAAKEPSADSSAGRGPYLNVVCQLCHVLDDLTVLRRLHL